MDVFFTLEKMQWGRDHAEILAILSTILLLALCHVEILFAEKRHPGTIESILRDWPHL